MRENISETFNSKSTWNHSNWQQALEMFFIKVGEDAFLILPGKVYLHNFPKDVWFSMRGIVIKPGDKCSSIVVRNRKNVLAEAENHVKGNYIYKKVTFVDEDLVKLLDENNKIIKTLLNDKKYRLKELNAFATSLANLVVWEL